MKRVSNFTSDVWRWPGYAGWHFVNLPKPISMKIKNFAKPYGAGFVKVKVEVGKSKWDTALFPHKESATYLLSIKKSVRGKEHIWEGDKVKIKITA